MVTDMVDWVTYRNEVFRVIIVIVVFVMMHDMMMICVMHHVRMTVIMMMMYVFNVLPTNRNYEMMMMMEDIGFRIKRIQYFRLVVN